MIRLEEAPDQEDKQACLPRNTCAPPLSVTIIGKRDNVLPHSKSIHSHAIVKAGREFCIGLKTHVHVHNYHTLLGVLRNLATAFLIIVNINNNRETSFYNQKANPMLDRLVLKQAAIFCLKMDDGLIALDR